MSLQAAVASSSDAAGLMVLTETPHERLEQSPAEQYTFASFALLVYRHVTSRQPVIW